MLKSKGKNLQSKKCEICNRKLNKNEIQDSDIFIGGNRYFCNEHLKRKMDW